MGHLHELKQNFVNEMNVDGWVFIKHFPHSTVIIADDASCKTTPNAIGGNQLCNIVLDRICKKLFKTIMETIESRTIHVDGNSLGSSWPHHGVHVCDDESSLTDEMIVDTEFSFGSFFVCVAFGESLEHCLGKSSCSTNAVCVGDMKEQFIIMNGGGHVSFKMNDHVCVCVCVVMVCYVYVKM